MNTENSKKDISDLLLNVVATILVEVGVLILSRLSNHFINWLLRTKEENHSKESDTL